MARADNLSAPLITIGVRDRGWQLRRIQACCAAGFHHHFGHFAAREFFVMAATPGGAFGRGERPPISPSAKASSSSIVR